MVARKKTDETDAKSAGDKAVTADTSFQDFFDARRNSSAFKDRVDEVVSGTFGLTKDKPAIKLELLGTTDAEGDEWRFGSDEFRIRQNVRGARELAAAYALYRRAVIRKGGTPSSFARPTKDGFE